MVSSLNASRSASVAGRSTGRRWMSACSSRSDEDAQHFTSRWQDHTPATANAAMPSTAGTTARTGSTESGTIPVIEEQLEIGKRQVETGTVHVTSHIVETPVNESVTLREEHADIQRRPVDRPATEADLDAFK
ncbi:MAG: DUF2382 domain-containing protein, partial [Oxalobacteraceae bacterium]